jgi:hypothetical protein
MWLGQGNALQMSIWKKIVIGLVSTLTIIQFFQPPENKQPNTAMTVSMSENIKHILSRSCFDCHSNNTKYPWYFSIQPTGWILARHIQKGKANLNFDAFTSYSDRRQLNKLRSIKTSIKEGSMPLPSYLLFHQDAQLSAAEKRLITQWAELLTDSIARRKK